MKEREHRRRTLHRRRRSTEAFLVLVISKGPDDSLSSSAAETPLELLSPASKSLLSRRCGEPFKKLITVAGEMAPSHSNSMSSQYPSYQRIQTKSLSQSQNSRSQTSISYHSCSSLNHTFLFIVKNINMTWVTEFFFFLNSNQPWKLNVFWGHNDKKVSVLLTQKLITRFQRILK